MTFQVIPRPVHCPLLTRTAIFVAKNVKPIAPCRIEGQFGNLEAPAAHGNEALPEWFDPNHALDGKGPPLARRSPKLRIQNGPWPIAPRKFGNRVSPCAPGQTPPGRATGPTIVPPGRDWIAPNWQTPGRGTPGSLAILCNGRTRLYPAQAETARRIARTAPDVPGRNNAKPPTTRQSSRQPR